MKRPNNVLQIKVTEDRFFRAWMDFLYPYHHLAPRGRDVAAKILSQYFKLRNAIKDPEVLREVLWSKNSKKDIMASLGMSQENFFMFIAKLKKAEFLLNDDINPKYIPNITDGEPRLLLLAMFDWSTPQNPIQNNA